MDLVARMAGLRNVLMCILVPSRSLWQVSLPCLSALPLPNCWVLSLGLMPV